MSELIEFISLQGKLLDFMVKLHYCCSNGGSCGARMVWDKTEQERLNNHKRAIEGVCNNE